MPIVPPTTTTAPSVDISALLEPLPVVEPAIGVSGGRLGRLGLDPADALRSGVVEAVNAADAGEHDIAGSEDVHLAVELSLDHAREEVVRLLEWVVVLLRRSVDLVVDREHRQEVGAEDAIEPPLPRDRVVRHEGTTQARRAR